MEVELDGQAIGQTAARTYFRLNLNPGKYTITSKGENVSTLALTVDDGKTYYVWQEVKMGFASAGSLLQQVDESKGRADIAESKLIASSVSDSDLIAQETIRDGQYTSPNRMFSVNVPKSSNWAGVSYVITPLDTQGDNQYDKVMFHVGDFGEYLVIGARIMPAIAVPEMDKDEHRTVLRNLSEASLMGWRSDFSTLPGVSEESFFDSIYGEAIVRVYHAQKGSFLASAKGRKPTPDDAFDTNIASVVARRGKVVVFVLVQDDSKPDSPSVLKEKADQIFRSLKVLRQ